MKVKTSISLSDSVLKGLDRRARQFRVNRSELIETAIASYLAQVARDEQNARDLAIINKHADRLNQEAADVLEYQLPL
jgi:metal-responsive CopG/Arc/MetJ family transcriptional regulator